MGMGRNSCSRPGSLFVCLCVCVCEKMAKINCTQWKYIPYLYLLGGTASLERKYWEGEREIDWLHSISTLCDCWSYEFWMIDSWQIVPPQKLSGFSHLHSTCQCMCVKKILFIPQKYSSVCLCALKSNGKFQHPCAASSISHVLIHVYAYLRARVSSYNRIWPVDRALVIQTRSSVLKGTSTKLTLAARFLALSGYMKWWVVWLPASSS